MQPQQQGPQSVQSLLQEARHALQASNAPQALQCVVQALKLLHGNNAVLPALRAAAESYHAHKAATINDLAQLLAQVSLAADQDMHMEQQQQHTQLPGALPSLHPHMLDQQQHHYQQQQQQQYHLQQHYRQQHSADERPILEETGRGDFTEAAMSDGSSWQCPHCSGVVAAQRQQAHLAHWCPALQQAG